MDNRRLAVLRTPVQSPLRVVCEPRALAVHGTFSTIASVKKCCTVLARFTETPRTHKALHVAERRWVAVAPASTRRRAPARWEASPSVHGSSGMAEALQDLAWTILVSARFWRPRGHIF